MTEDFYFYFYFILLGVSLLTQIVDRGTCLIVLGTRWVPYGLLPPLFFQAPTPLWRLVQVWREFSKLSGVTSQCLVQVCWIPGAFPTISKFIQIALRVLVKAEVLLTLCDPECLVWMWTAPSEPCGTLRWLRPGQTTLLQTLWCGKTGSICGHHHNCNPTEWTFIPFPLLSFGLVPV